MEGPLTRRTFLVGAGAAALLAACADGDPSSLGVADGGSRTTVTRGGTGTTTGGGGNGGGGQEPNHYRLSSRRSPTKPCNACISHSNSRFYATAAAAEADRPHAGCHCQVRGRVVSDDELEAMFRGGDRDIYDTRTD